MTYRILASLGLALVAVSAVADAQRPPDSTRVRQQADTSRAGQDSAGIVRAEARGDVTLTANRGLTRAQVRQLQNALRQAGCNPGAADGIFGPRTSQALACVRRQRGIEAGNTNDVLRALDLRFTLTDSIAAGTNVATAERGEPRYSDPTFVRDTGVIRIDADTMPAGLLESSAVFVPSVTSSRGLYLRQTSLDRRTTEVLVPRDTAGVRPDTAAMRRDTMPARRQATTPAPAARRDTTPRMRTDTTPRTRTDTTARTRADTVRTQRTDTTLLRADTTRTALPDSTLRRMRDELLLMPISPRPDTLRDTLQRRDTTKTRPDSTRPDTTRTRPDTTRRRPPPARH